MVGEVQEAEAGVVLVVVHALGRTMRSCCVCVPTAEAALVVVLRCTVEPLALRITSECTYSISSAKSTTSSSSI
jgi:hypothetical protein